MASLADNAGWGVRRKAGERSVKRGVHACTAILRLHEMMLSNVHSVTLGAALSGQHELFVISTPGSVCGGLDNRQCRRAAQVGLAVGLPPGQLPRRLLAIGSRRRRRRLKRQLRLHARVSKRGAQAANHPLGAVAGIRRVVCRVETRGRQPQFQNVGT